MIMDTLLVQFKKGAVKAVGYADDILLLATGRDKSTLVEIMQTAINRVSEWGQAHGLTFNPTKTTVLPLERGTYNNTWRTRLMLGETTLPYSTEMKYLGLTLKKGIAGLSWHRHVTEKVGKAMRVLNLARAIVGHKWGLTPEKIFWVYTMMVRPIISYGSIVWSHNLTETLKQKLKRVQSLAIRSVAPVMRSAPTAGLEATIGLLPLDLHVQSLATKARLRTRVILRDSWDGVGSKQRGHDEKLREAGVRDLTLDQLCALNDWEPRQDVVLDPSLNVYTDGSKEEGRVGAGWAICARDSVVAEDSLRLNNEATVFQAEVIAISRALRWINNDDKYQGKSVHIWSDSQAAINAIFQVKKRSRVVKECSQQLALAQKTRDVQISWIKGHAGHTGNELADMLAKRGNSAVVADDGMIPIPVGYAKLKIDDFYTSVWQKQWHIATGMEQTKTMFPSVSRSKLKKLLRLRRSQLTILMEAGTGHGRLAYHLSRWRGVNPTCKLCLQGDEKFTHMLQECPILWRSRQEFDMRVEKNSSNPVAWERELIRFFSQDRLSALYQQNLDTG